MKITALRVFAAVAFVLFTFSFMKDVGLGSMAHLHFIPDEGEPKIYGRLAKTKQDGLFSSAALLGGCGGREMRQNVQHQIREYEAGKCAGEYRLYKSHNGGSGLMFAAIDAVFGSRLALRLFPALLLSGALVSILLWIGGQFGLTGALFFALGVVSSRGLVLFGDNLSQFVAGQFVAPAALLWAFERKCPRLALVTFAVSFFRYVTSGMEYFLAGWIVSFLPLVYYAARDGWDRRKVLQDGLQIALGIGAATALSLTLLAVQISIVDSVPGAIAHLVDRIESRTHFPTSSPMNWPYYHMQMKKTTLTVLWEYLTMPALIFGSVKIAYLHLAAFYVLVTMAARTFDLDQDDARLRGLIWATWLAGAAALAWIVLMKGHSAAHPYSDPIVWSMPFLPLGMAMTAIVAGKVFGPKSARSR